MAVKDKLELERLLSIREDLESMYRNSDISEETYREMKKTYDVKISKLQDKIMDVSEDNLEELREHSKQYATKITDNVNDILKETMKTLKEQLKTAGMDESNKRFKKEDTRRIPLDSDGNIVIKCNIERGKIYIRGGSVHSLTIVSEKQVQSETMFDAQEKLEKIDLGIDYYIQDNKNVIDIEPDCPKNSSVDYLIKVPDRIIENCNVSIERGAIIVNDADCMECKLKSENGKVEIKDFSCNSLSITAETGSISMNNITIDDMAEIKSENGNLKLFDVFGNTLKASTEKGNITAYCSFKRSKLSTELGSVKFKSISSKNQYNTITSELGSIVIIIEDELLPWLISAHVERGAIKNKTSLVKRMSEDGIMFESTKLGDSKNPLVIAASTELGSISLRNE